VLLPLKEALVLRPLDEGMCIGKPPGSIQVGNVGCEIDSTVEGEDERLLSRFELQLVCVVSGNELGKVGEIGRERSPSPNCFDDFESMLRIRELVIPEVKPLLK
jgi:hypothetical protein